MKRWMIRILIALVLGFATTLAIAWLAAWRGPAELHDGFGTIVRGEVNGEPAAWRATRHRSFGYEQWQSISIYGPMVERMLEQDRAYPDTTTGQVYVDVIDPLAETDVPAWSRVRGAPDLAEAMRFRSDRDVVELAAGWPMYAFTATIYNESIGARQRAESNERMVIEGDDLTWTLPGGNELHFKLHPGDGVEGGVLLDAGSPLSGAWIPPRALPMRPLWFGLIVNMLIFSAAWFVFLIAPGAMRRQHRRVRGRCPNCGYDLQGELDAGCPECGWGRNASPTPLAASRP